MTINRADQKSDLAPRINAAAVGRDEVLAVEFLVAWAGEKRSRPPRFGWWDTDLVDDVGGGDLLARLAPRTHAWAGPEAVSEAARRVDARRASGMAMVHLDHHSGLYQVAIDRVAQPHV